MITQQRIQTATLAGHWQGPISCCLKASLRRSSAQTLRVIAENKISNPANPGPSAYSLLASQKEHVSHELTKMLWLYKAFAEERER